MYFLFGGLIQEKLKGAHQEKEVSLKYYKYRYAQFILENDT